MQNCFANSGDAVTGCDYILPDLDLTSNASLYSAFTTAHIKTINVSGWSLKAAGVSGYTMFYNSKWNLGGQTTLDLSSWTNTSGLGDMRKSFRAMTGFTSLNLTGWILPVLQLFWRVLSMPIH